MSVPAGGHRGTHAASALLLVLAGLACLSPVPAEAVASEPVRVLLVGDSVTQGSAGDWTWRYRLWQHLENVGADVDLVGPRTDLYDNVEGTHGSAAYADPGFDRDHAARWGMLMGAPDVPLGELVETYRPDVVVEARGLNDFVWLDASASGVLGLLEDEVAEVRAVDPDVDMVVTRLPQTWYDARRTHGQIGAYNDGLGDLADSLDTPGSRVVATATGSGFVEDVDTWDPAHLSARGEVRMAAAVADGLAAVGVGAPHPRPLPVVSNGHWTPADLTVRAGHRSAELRWSSGPGIADEYVWSRDLTAGRGWTRSQEPVPGPTLTAAGLVDGHTYEFRLQGRKGSVRADRYSAAVRVTPVPPPPEDRPGVRVRRDDHAVRLTWKAVPRADSYVVTWAGGGTSGSRRVTGTSLEVRRLRAGAPYAFRVTPRNLNPVAGPTTTVRAVPRGPVPAAPARPRTRLLERSVVVSWRPAEHATTYAVWHRGSGAWRRVVVTSRPTARLARPDRGLHRWRVRAWHDRLAGPWSRTVRLRVR